MTQKHTPGPWRYKRDFESNYMLIYCHNNQNEGDNLRGYCGEANARLIAAAPDLLEALKDARAKLHKAMTVTGIGEKFADIACSRFDSAIAKATVQS